MFNVVKAEFLKQRHRFNLKLVWISPLIPIVLVLVLMHGRFFIEGAFNWWYTLILPGTLAMLIAFTVSNEKRYNRHGLFAVCIDKKKLWIGQILMKTIVLLLMNGVFFICLVLAGFIFGLPVPVTDSIVACGVLAFTFAWQIPTFMFVSEKIGSVYTIMLSLFCNMGFGIVFATSKLWYIPFSIPSRLMCPIIKVMPNGLPLEEGHRLMNSNVIITGMLITGILYVGISLITAVWFNKREVN